MVGLASAWLASSFAISATAAVYSVFATWPSWGRRSTRFKRSEAPAHRRLVAGSLQREGSLCGGLVHRGVEADGNPPVRQDLACVLGRRDSKYQWLGCGGGTACLGSSGKPAGYWRRCRGSGVGLPIHQRGARGEDEGVGVPAEAAAHHGPSLVRLSEKAVSAEACPLHDRRWQRSARCGRPRSALGRDTARQWAAALRWNCGSAPSCERGHRSNRSGRACRRPVGRCWRFSARWR